MWWHHIPVCHMMVMLALPNFVDNMKQIAVVQRTGLRGKETTLPCDISHPPEDTIFLLLWFKDGLTTPIYRFDDRSLVSGKDEHWSDSKVLDSRATLDVASTPAHLRLTSLRDEDQGLYRCRVDFKNQPTKTTRVNLTVVTPPESVSVVIRKKDGSVVPVTSVVGPYLEGDFLQLTCIAHGGNPCPSVVWFEDTHLLDSHMESLDSENTTSSTISPPSGNTTTLSPGPTLDPRMLDLSSPSPPTKEEEPSNTLTLGPLTRSDLKLLLTCEASNNNITLPTSVVVMVDMNLPPLAVGIVAPDLPLVAEKEYEVLCEVKGSRPPPTITWWSGDQRVLQANKQTSSDGNVTTSALSFRPRPRDDGTTLRCIAENHATDTRLQDTWELSVHYTPKTKANFGSSLDEKNIKEGDDVYFECSILANPKVSHVSWRHNNKVLVHNISAGVIVSNQSLVLQRVSKAQAGRYSCHAHNVIGDGSSNTLRLDVKCQTTTYPVGRYEDAEVTCSVQANPLQASFRWTFNNTADTIDVPQGRFTSSSSHSIITYTPMTSLDYGTLLCWASNEIGTQKEPCVFHIVPAGKPDPPMNCSVQERTPVSAIITCEEGSSGGLNQTFILEASVQNTGVGVGGGRHTLNVTSPKPSFSLEGLHAGQDYKVLIRAKNEKGFSVPTHLTIRRPTGDIATVYQPHDGPSEAEVRDGGKNGSGAENHEELRDKENQGGSELSSLSHILPIILGLCGGLLLVSSTIVFLIVLRIRRRRPPRPPLASTSIGHPPRAVMKSPILSPKHLSKSSTSERELQAESESDADPDVIPLQEPYYSPEVEVCAPATVLPPEKYKYAPLPVTLPSMVNPRYTRLSMSPSTSTLSGATLAEGESGKDVCKGGRVKGEGTCTLTGGGGRGGVGGAKSRMLTLPYDSRTHLSECQLHLNPAQHLCPGSSSTLPRAPSSSSSSYSSSRCPRGSAMCQGQALDPHSCPFPGLEGSLPPLPLNAPREEAKGPSHPLVTSPNSCEDGGPTTPLLNKRESSV